MELFVSYILKSSLCLALFYLFYKLLLSKETFHGVNRVALLVILCVSLIIPSIEINIPETSRIGNLITMLERHARQSPDEKTTTVEASPLISDTSNDGELLANITDPAENSMLIDNPLVDIELSNNISSAKRNLNEPVIVGNSEPVLFNKIIKTLILIYITGILFFFFRSLYSLIRLTSLLRHSRKESIAGGVSLIIHDRKIAPFSWMKLIIISADDFEDSGEEIITHERAHIGMYHTFDLILCELLILLQWFNPAAWLIRRELQDIHEYQADNAVINSGIDAKKYQLLLVKKAVGTERFISMTNSFNHSKLKKRVTMMLKEKSNKWVVAKYLYALPLMAIILTAFANPVKVTELSSENTTPQEISQVQIETKKDTVKLTEQQKKELQKSVEEAMTEARIAIQSVDLESIRKEYEKAMIQANQAMSEMNTAMRKEHEVIGATMAKAREAMKEELEAMRKEYEAAMTEARKAMKEVDLEKIGEEYKKAVEEAIAEAEKSEKKK